MSILSDIDSHAAGLAALAALLAVVIGPALQSIAAVKQGRSQAIAAFTGSLTQSAINETARLISLVADLYSSPKDGRKSIQKEIYNCELKVTLIVGTSTEVRNQVVTYLSLIRSGAESFVTSDEMERLVAELKTSFDKLIKEERVNVRQGN